ncbi:MAG TPA: hypothetical protein DEV81_04640 [Cyanobacteria bacterium UBA11049]|nr:hypothetical protein [Cyanobacteria bacterium UBA11049]
MKQSENNQEWFGPLFRLTGYCLLALSALDILGLFIPLRFTDPVWELQLVNQLVERVPVPLLGLVLVLIGEQSFRIFKFLSWASLVVAVLFFLLMPLAISSTLRIEWQPGQRIAQIQEFKQQLNQANTPEQISQLLKNFNLQNVPSEIKNNPEELKRQLLVKLDRDEQVIKLQAINFANSSFERYKNAVRLVLGSLISGTVFLILWGKTRKILRASTARK